MAVTGVAGVVAGLDAAALAEAEVRVARERGVALAVVGCALKGSLNVGEDPARAGRSGVLLNRRATSGR